MILSRMVCTSGPQVDCSRLCHHEEPGFDDFLPGHEPVAYLLAIGAPKVCERLVARFDDAGWRAASVVQGLSIGADTTVGAGAVVTRTVPDGVVVKGVPGVWS